MLSYLGNTYCCQMESRNTFFFIFVIILTAVPFIILNEREKRCNILIITKKGESIRARRINWYKSGFLDVRRCDGSSLVITDNMVDTIRNTNGYGN